MRELRPLACAAIYVTAVLKERLLCRYEGYLKPVAIQLISDPEDQKKDPKEQGEVYTPNDATELWTLAKAVFGNLDFCAHSAMACFVMPPHHLH